MFVIVYLCIFVVLVFAYDVSVSVYPSLKRIAEHGSTSEIDHVCKGCLGSGLVESRLQRIFLGMENVSSGDHSLCGRRAA